MFASRFRIGIMLSMGGYATPRSKLVSIDRPLRQARGAILAASLTRP
jgi:hypothetical protein